MSTPSGARATIRLRFIEAPRPNQDQRYRIAGTDLWSNRTLAELSPFQVPAPSPAPGRMDPPSRPLDDAQLPLVYEGRGWVGGREVGVVARAAGELHRVELEDGTSIEVFGHSGEVLVWVSEGNDPEAGRFGALGPGLALALALAGRFSLHAGAVSIAGRAAVLIGESGAGKSTMARLASARPGCRRLADDVVPVRASPDGQLVLAPGFPQLKLDRNQQWQGDEELACRDLIAIRRDPKTRSVRFSELSPRDSVLKLLESTVASRLFSKQLRARELDVWTAVAGAHRVVEWRIPDDAARVAESFAALETRLAERAGRP